MLWFLPALRTRHNSATVLVAESRKCASSIIGIPARFLGELCRDDRQTLGAHWRSFGGHIQLGLIEQGTDRRPFRHSILLCITFVRRMTSTSQKTLGRASRLLSRAKDSRSGFPVGLPGRVGPTLSRQLTLSAAQTIP